MAIVHILVLLALWQFTSAQEEPWVDRSVVGSGRLRNPEQLNSVPLSLNDDLGVSSRRRPRACNFTEQPLPVCESCNRVYICRPNNRAVRVRCRGPLRFCNEGSCSVTPGELCSPSTTPSTTSSTTSSSTTPSSTTSSSTTISSSTPSSTTPSSTTPSTTLGD